MVRLVKGRIAPLGSRIVRKTYSGIRMKETVSAMGRLMLMVELRLTQTPLWPEKCPLMKLEVVLEMGSRFLTSREVTCGTRIRMVFREMVSRRILAMLQLVRMLTMRLTMALTTTGLLKMLNPLRSTLAPILTLWTLGTPLKT